MKTWALVRRTKLKTRLRWNVQMQRMEINNKLSWLLMNVVRNRSKLDATTRPSRKLSKKPSRRRNASNTRSIRSRRLNLTFLLDCLRWAEIQPNKSSKHSSTERIKSTRSCFKVSEIKRPLWFFRHSGTCYSPKQKRKKKKKNSDFLAILMRDFN